MNIIGIDISKAAPDADLRREAAPDKGVCKKTSNSLAGFKSLIAWGCKKTGCKPGELHFILEATGPYHEAAAQAFFKAGAKVSVANPAQIKRFASGYGVNAENGKQDAATVALFGLKTNPRLQQPEPEEFRRLRALLRRLQAVEKDIQREKNRMEKTEISGAGQTVTDFLERSIAFPEEEKELLEKRNRERIQSCPGLKEDQEPLESIPAIGPVLSPWMTLLLQRGARFDSAPQAAACTGIFPAERQSGESVRKKPRMSKDGPAVFRAKLCMAAMVASRHNPDVKALYDRMIAKGKAPKSALGAAMRKLVHICFGAIKNRTPYTPQISR